MAVILTYGAGLPVVKVGRIAGQFAKPRSLPSERVDGIELPVPRRHGQRPGLRRGVAPARPGPDAARLPPVVGHPEPAVCHQGAGSPTSTRCTSTFQEFVARSPSGRRYDAVADGIDQALRFMAACGIDLATSSVIHQVDYLSRGPAARLRGGHDQARQPHRVLVRLLGLPAVGGGPDPPAGRRPPGFLRGIGSPVAAKLRATATPAETVALCDVLDPGQVPGRPCWSPAWAPPGSRSGWRRWSGRSATPATRSCGHATRCTATPSMPGPSGHKTRRFDDVMAELAGFFAVHTAEGTHPGGIHVELTGEDVTECLGGSDEIEDGHLHRRYETACDPRLNASQALELAFGDRAAARPRRSPVALTIRLAHPGDGRPGPLPAGGRAGGAAAVGIVLTPSTAPRWTSATGSRPGRRG